ncbi:MAG TPA: diadenylate cyclase, partial [Oligoflexia bacterium]|nr:diadenylate cyclase [Oligoflexia bacterium]
AVFPGLSLHVTGAGSMEIFFAGNLLTAYRKGIELIRRIDIFQISSLDEQFEYIGRELLDACRQQYDREEIGNSVDIDRKFFGHLTRQMIKRMIAAIRASNHGGTVLVVPQDMEESLAADNEDIRIRARFAPSPVRSRQRDLMLEAGRLLRSLAPGGEPRNVGWAEYSQMSHPALDVIDTAIFDSSHFIAALTNTDGAVVLSDFKEVLGFGAEILCYEMDVRQVFRACDVNADVVEQESADQFGTRHRSAYRFVAKYPRAIAIVISQDGSVRLVVWRNGRVVYFEHDDLSASTFVL